MTFDERLTQMISQLRQIGMACLAEGELHAAHEITGACLVLDEVKGKMYELDLDEHVAPE